MSDDIQFTLGEIKGTLTEILRRLDRRDKEVDDDIAEAKKAATDAHVRVAKVERRFAYYVGAGSVVMWLLTHAPQWLGIFKAI